MDKSLLRNDWNATLILLSLSSHPNADRCSQEGANYSVCPEGELILVLDFTLILPGPSLRVCHILAEA